MRRDKLTIYRAEDGWRWRYVASNGDILGDSGQGYSRHIDAVRGAARVTADAQREPPLIWDHDGEYDEPEPTP